MKVYKNLILLAFIIFIAAFLRIYKVSENPPGLSWDEASLGYNAYTILNSGRDEHGEFLPFNRFIAFGDYKPPGYIYVSVPFIKIFGLTEIAVRMPSILAGILIVLFTYLLARELITSEIATLFSALFIAISPWAIQFSRAAFESNLATLFNLVAIYFFVLSLRKKWAILFSSLFFILSFYTFNANRIIAPLLLFSLLLFNFRNLLRNKRIILLTLIISICLLVPSVSYLSDRESRLRFQEVSIFNNLDTIKLSNERIMLDNNSYLSILLHNRRVLFASEFIKHYFDNFSGRFLFTDGDVNPRLSIQSFGELYIYDIIFLIVGIYFLIKKKKRAFLILLLWIAIVPIPAATARETPHALRILSLLPALEIIIGFGFYEIILLIKQKFSYLQKIFLYALFTILLFISFFYYTHNYFIHYPLNWSNEWQYGYKEMVKYVTDNQYRYDTIYITEALGRPYIYFAFYNKYHLEEFLSKRIATRDWFGFWYVKSLGKVKFGLDDLHSTFGKKTLLVATPGSVPDEFRTIKTIKNLAGEDILLITSNK